MEQQFIVENIKCGGCVNSIQTTLQKIKAVEKVAVDIENGTIVITGNPDREVILKKLNEMGYPELGNNTIVKKAKSYVSCAIGKMTKE
jgi:copper chaperone